MGATTGFVIFGSTVTTVDPHLQHTCMPLCRITLTSTISKGPLELLLHNPLSFLRTHRLSKPMGWTSAEGYVLCEGQL
jgi:hypothetical protein